MKNIFFYLARVLVIMLIAYCHSSAQPLSVEVSPAEYSIIVGESAIFTLDIKADSGFDATIYLTTKSSLPGFTIALSQSSLNPPYGSITLKVVAVGDSGTTTISIAATAGMSTSTAECRIHANRNPLLRKITNPNERKEWGKTLINDENGAVVGISPKAFNEFENSLYPIVHFLSVDKRGYDTLQIKSTIDLFEPAYIFDKDGSFWVYMLTGVYNGIIRWSKSGYTEYTHKNSALAGNSVYELDFDKTNTPIAMVYNTDNTDGFAVIQKMEKLQWVDIYRCKIGVDPYHRDKRQKELCIDSSGAIWFTTLSNGVIRINGAIVDTFTTSNSDIGNNFTSRIFCDRSGAIWCYHDKKGGASIFNGNSWRHLPVADNMMNYAIDRNNSVWILADSKLIRYNGNEMTEYTSANTPLLSYFTLEAISSLAIDSSNNLWIGIGSVEGNSFTFCAIFNPDGLKGIPIVLSAEEPELPTAGVVISPNPATESFTVRGSENAAVTVKDVFGRVLLTGVTQQSFPTFDLAPGVYFVEVFVGNGKRIVEKVVVSR